MEKKNKEKLNKLLADRKKIKEEFEQKAKEDKDEKKTFNDNFEKFSKERIEPIMKEFGDKIKENGHDYKITYIKKDQKSNGLMEPKLMMEIYPNGEGRGSLSSKAAHIMFYADDYKKIIGIHENNIVPSGGGGSAGTRNYDYTFKTLNTEKIEEEILESISKIL